MVIVNPIFYIFSGLIGGNSEQMELWEMLWFAVIWLIWSSQNSLIFKLGKRSELGDMVKNVKLKTWLWIIAKSPQFRYLFSNWCSNPRGCLGLQ